ncbi:membrane bound O-acyl transferase family-domain-containing protein [Aspergillus karnatakaensis]|uniref:wax synthase family protein n=1 Tax=Aspergillus karnatakaensis TaxID=1810916 RepID=UPI003CCDE1F7
MPDTPPWLVPALSWSTIHLLTGLTVTFTTRTSPLRILTAATTFLLAYILQINVKAHYHGTPPSGPLVAMTWVSVLNGIDLLLLSRVDWKRQTDYTLSRKKKKDDDKKGDSLGLSDKILFALQIPLNYRRINTPWAISRLPSFDSKNPSYIPSKSTFLSRGLLTLLITFAFVAIIPLDPDNPYIEATLSTLNTKPSLLALPLRSLTDTLEKNTASLLLQARYTLSFATVTRATILATYTLLSVLAVLLGSDPSSWPPVFAGIGEASSLRGLWGQSWHQLFRRPFTAPATHLLSFLGIPPSSSVSHWTRIVVAFVGSGIIHALCDIGFGVSWEESGGLLFFTLQIPGLIIESIAGSLGDKVGLRRDGGLRKGLGYIWVAGYLLWSAPLWINPILVSIAKDGTKVMSPWFGLRPEWFH